MINLLIEVVLVTASGALSPGPLTFSTAMLGVRKGWKAGLFTALGHTIFEFPLVLVMTVGVVEITKSVWALDVIGVIGGVALLAFSVLTLVDLFNTIKGKETKTLKVFPNPLVTGLAFTALNPYFIIWWATVGLKLITDIVVVGGTLLVALLYPFHVWMDYAWLSLVAFLSSKGKSLGQRGQVIIMITLIVILVYYGVSFLVNSITK